MRRGELWTVAGGAYATKPGPALILQDDLFDLTESVTVAPLTANPIDAPLLRQVSKPQIRAGWDAIATSWSTR